MISDQVVSINVPLQYTQLTLPTAVVAYCLNRFLTYTLLAISAYQPFSGDSLWVMNIRTKKPR